jgi:hypothetical protein
MLELILSPEVETRKVFKNLVEVYGPSGTPRILSGILLKLGSLRLRSQMILGFFEYWLSPYGADGKEKLH